VVLVLVPLAIIVLIFIAWKLLSGFPRKQNETVRTSTVAVTTIGEEAGGSNPDLVGTAATAPSTATIVEGNDSGSDMSPLSDPMPAPPVPVNQQPPLSVPAPPSPPAPAPVPPSQPERSLKEMTETQARGALLDWLASTRYYSVSTECLGVRSRGYSNRGYVIEAYAKGCSNRDDGTLDRWRVDALTHEVFRQNEDGRYVRP
jgi:hypothetical protein